MLKGGTISWTLKGNGAGLHFYELVDLLFAESEFVQVEEAYLKQNQTTRHTQLGQKVLQHQLFVLWEDYDRDKTDTYRMLQKLTRLYTKTIKNFDDDV